MKILNVALIALAACAQMGPSEQEAKDRGLGTDSLRWVAVDPHLHPACGEMELPPEELARRMVAQGIDIGSNLINAEVQWRELEGESAGRVYQLGDEPVSGAILHNDYEIGAFAENEPGHLLLYGLDQLSFHSLGSARNLYHFTPSNISAIDWALGQNPQVVAGYAHAWAWPAEGFPTVTADSDSACCTPFELPINVARGKVHFLSDEANLENISWLPGRVGPLSSGGYRIWSRLLNVGYQLPIMGGSDIGCLSSDVGAPRTLALIEGEPSFDAFLDAVREGRTVISVSRDERLDILVNDQRLGAQVIAPQGSVTVEIRSKMDVATTVELLVNGVPTSVPVAAGEQVTTMPLQLEQSAWIAARSRNLQTSPIYVLARGESSIRASADDACYLMRYVDHLRDVVLPQNMIVLPAEEKQVSLDAYAQARAEFEMRFAEAGGIECAR